MELFIDTETSDKFDFKRDDYRDEGFPWCVQVGAVLAHENVVYAELNCIVAAEGREISNEAFRVHNISYEDSERYGLDEGLVVSALLDIVSKQPTIVCHNYSFDAQILAAMIYRQGYAKAAQDFLATPHFCTMLATTDLCKLPGKYGKFKWPKLDELHKHLFQTGFQGAHDAMYDIRATMKCFYQLKEIGWIR